MLPRGLSGLSARKEEMGAPGTPVVAVGLATESDLESGGSRKGSQE